MKPAPDPAPDPWFLVVSELTSESSLHFGQKSQPTLGKHQQITFPLENVLKQLTPLGDQDTGHSTQHTAHSGIPSPRLSTVHTKSSRPPALPLEGVHPLGAIISSGLNSLVVCAQALRYS